MVELKSGYLVKISYDGEETFAQIIETVTGLGLSSKSTWFPVECIQKTGEYQSCRILEVYGKTSNMGACRWEVNDRKLLWKYERPKLVTVSEIENILGYKIKIKENE